jgi:hypothetical protein
VLRRRFANSARRVGRFLEDRALRMMRRHAIAAC